MASLLGRCVRLYSFGFFLFLLIIANKQIETLEFEPNGNNKTRNNRYKYKNVNDFCYFRVVRRHQYSSHHNDMTFQWYPKKSFYSVDQFNLQKYPLIRFYKRFLKQKRRRRNNKKGLAHAEYDFFAKLGWMSLSLSLSIYVQIHDILIFFIESLDYDHYVGVSFE